MTMTNYVEQTLRLAYLRAAYQDLKDEEAAMHRNRDFYDGEQGIQLTARQKEYLGDIANDLSEQALCNICKRAVEIPGERLAVEELTSEQGDSTLADMAKLWWEMNQLGAWQYDIYEQALRDSTSCLIVGWDEDHPTYTLNELWDGKDGSVRLHYSEDDGTLLFASKRYSAYDPVMLQKTGKVRLTLYFADRIERYEDSTGDPTGWRLLRPDEIEGTDKRNPMPWVDTDGNPLGIAVIAFDNPGGSELDDVLMPQKALNKGAVDLLSTQDLHGFPLLVLKGFQATIDTEGKQTPLNYQPGRAITMPAAGSADRIPGVDLSPMFETGVLGWLQLVSIIKGWPLYLWARGEPPSGESLKVMESSLVNQVKRKQESFRDSWLEAFAMGARLHKLYTGQELTGDLVIQWKDPETRQELAHWQALQTKWDAAQIPITQRWREAGYTDEQIALMQEEQRDQAARAAQQAMLQVLMAQRGQTEQGVIEGQATPVQGAIGQGQVNG